MDFQRKPLIGTDDLSSRWSYTTDLTGANPPVRFEGEIGDVIVHGRIPDCIDGTLYRVSQDPIVPPHSRQVAIEGDGVVSVFRIHKGRVDFKIRYVETERYLAQRKARRSLFGMYKNPWSYHPCVRAIVDSTANTNIIYWAGQLLALRESGNPYTLDPNTLETGVYDPYSNQVDSEAFTAHPKIDPFRDELVVFGYEAKGPGTKDVVLYSIDRKGKVHNLQWIEAPFATFIHDMALTENFIVLLLWPFEADMEGMKNGDHHFRYDYDKEAAIIVVPRFPNQPPAGWKTGEHRTFYTKNCMYGHTASGFEEDGKIVFDTTRVDDNFFPFFPDKLDRKPKREPKADLVRFELDLSWEDGKRLGEPKVLVDYPNEFPRIDERFISKKYEVIFMAVFKPGVSDNAKNVFAGLNAIMSLNARTGETKTYWPGPHCICQEPIFIPRSDDAREADGFVIFMVDRKDVNISNLVILDTETFTPIAFADLPMRLRPQIHGNWVDARELDGSPLVREPPAKINYSGKGFASFVDLRDAKAEGVVNGDWEGLV